MSRDRRSSWRMKRQGLRRRKAMLHSLERLRSWEGVLLILLVVIVIFNSSMTPHYLKLQNQVNLFELHIEKIIVALVMTFIIINGEIDLSVASVMGLSACLLAFLLERGVPAPPGLAGV